MADNNYDPKLVGGTQPIFCPQCAEEVKPLDSYQLSTKNERYHYPECWQKHELSLPPTQAKAITEAAAAKSAVAQRDSAKLAKQHEPWKK